LIEEIEDKNEQITALQERLDEFCQAMTIEFPIIVNAEVNNFSKT
jgi:cell division septum initiation protein DivIVA